MGNVTDMAMFIINGRNLSDDEIALGQPDDKEAIDLNYHVARCAQRYRIFSRRQADQGNDIVQIKYMMFALIGAVALTSPQIRDFITWIFKAL